MGKIKEIAGATDSKNLAKRFAENKVKEVKGDGSGKATMNGRILPITDFKKVIEHDKIYLGTLQSLQANLSLYERLLAQKLTPIKNDDDKRYKRAKEFVEWDEVKIKLYDVRGMIETHNKLINDKLFHFENIAKKQFDKECEEMKDGEFEKVFETASSIANNLVELNLSEDCKTIKSEIKDELYWYSQLEDEHKNDMEYKLYLFKAIRRLSNAFNDKLEQNKA